ncbi:hypothetical protein AC579_4105 [Pseudocercospora musae]|uniref:Uncharacterized protein n=1 Tax=Pseudocercospora musae TaxID=113226 RepID=A0A139I3R7_9PEZI|nr:hypothetical protein AC579_4105 [Pseudocercospora musae]
MSGFAYQVLQTQRNRCQVLWEYARHGIRAVWRCSSRPLFWGLVDSLICTGFGSPQRTPDYDLTLILTGPNAIRLCKHMCHCPLEGLGLALSLGFGIDLTRGADRHKILLRNLVKYAEELSETGMAREKIAWD